MKSWRNALITMILLVGGLAAISLAQPVKQGRVNPPAQRQVEDAANKPQKEQATEESETAEADQLKALKEEQQRLSTEYQLLMQRQKNELAKLEMEKQALAAKAALRKALQDEELASLRDEVERLKAEAALKKARQDRELTEARAKIESIQVEQQLASAKRSVELNKLSDQASELQALNNVMGQKLKKAQLEANLIQQEYHARLADVEGRLSLRERKDAASHKVLDDVDYLKNPYIDGTLYISDRRIPLNGAIYEGAAEFVTERINFFNNQSKELPIFIVIDDCPGGSVMEGYRIVTAIETSPAPVYVVVKSFAASMAAVITTLADHSFAYPNAIILHHQMSGGMYGNLTQQAEQLEKAMEWARRLAEPVAEKMGVSYERFVEMMYEHDSSGDWEEFADVAVELNWVDHTVEEIREVGVRDRPTSQRGALPFFFQAEETDADGKAFIRLPRLRPFDFYFIYDPDEYYRY